MKKTLLLISCLLLGFDVWAAKHIRVPSQEPSLQKAVDSIEQGGTVEITGDITQSAFATHGRSFIIRGSNPAVTLGAAGPGGTVLRLSNHTQLVTIADLTIKGGNVAVHLSGAAPTLLDNVTITDAGVGVLVDRSGAAAPGLIRLNKVTIKNCRRYGFQASGSNLRICDSLFTSNQVNLYAGTNDRLYLRNSRVLLSKGDIGALVAGGEVTVLDSVFALNLNVGGLELDRVRSATIENSQFSLNYGSGLRIKRSSNVVINNCDFSNNVPLMTPSSSRGGGAVRAIKPTTVLRPPAAKIQEIAGANVQDAELVICAKGDSPDFYGMGLFVSDSSRVSIHNSRMKENHDSGFFVQNSRRISLSGSVVERNLSAGATALYSEGIYRRNRFNHNRKFGFESIAGVSTFENNEFSHNLTDEEGRWGLGLFIDNGHNRVVNNLFERNTQFGVWVQGEEDCPFSDLALKTDVQSNSFRYGQFGIVWNPSYEVHKRDNSFVNVGLENENGQRRPCARTGSDGP